MVRRRIAWLVIAAALFSGCGSSSSNSGQPKPSESINAFAQRVKKLSTSSCANLVALQKLFVNNSGFPPCAKAHQFLRNFTVTGAAAYGTGGTVDFTDAGDPKGGSYITSWSKDGKWVVVFSPATGQPTVGTSPPSTAPYKDALTVALQALRKRDCKTLFKYALTGPPQTASAFCAASFSNPVTKQIDAHPSAKPIAFGGNRLVEFYGLALGNHYYTFPVLGPPPGGPQQYLAISPTAAS